LRPINHPRRFGVKEAAEVEERDRIRGRGWRLVYAAAVALMEVQRMPVELGEVAIF
jgi:hypothetical protein